MVNELGSAVTDGGMALISLAKEVSAVCPIAEGAFGGLLWIVESAKQFKENKVEWTSFSKFVGDLLHDIARSAEGFGTNPPSGFAGDIDSLQQSLKSIRKGMEEMQRRHRISRLLQAREDPKKIAEFRQILNTAMIRFNTLHLMSQTMKLVSIEAKIDVLPTQLEPALKKTQDAEFYSTLPPPPAHLFGRDDYVSRMVDVITLELGNSTSRSAHLAILGAGGVGKTSVALHVLHNPRIKELFPGSVHFISCEAITTAASLILAVSSALGIPQSGGSTLFRFTAGLARLSERTLLCLDNFETCWLTDARSDVQQVLEHLSAVKLITLIVTMRGLERPAAAKIAWGKLDPLPVLQLEAARSTYLSITQDESGGETLDRLLSLVDFMPLAITLLARRSQATGDSVELLHDMWISQQLETINLEPCGKDDNMDVSIRLSIDSKPLQEDALAKRVLAILGLLPDGASINDLLAWTGSSDLSEGTHAIWTLKKMAMAYEDAPARIRTLSLVRSYAHRHLKPQPSDFDRMREDFFQLISGATDFRGSDYITILHQFRLEIGNIACILKEMMSDSITSALGNAVIQFSNFVSVERQNTDLLGILVSKGAAGLDAHLQAWAKLALGWTLCSQLHCDDARIALEEARKLYQDLDDDTNAAYCLKALGDNFWYQSRIDESEAAYSQAISEFRALGHISGVAACFESVGDSLRHHARYAESKATIEEAQAIFLEDGDPRDATSCLQRLAQIMIPQGQYSAAQAALEQAILEFQAYGRAYHTGYCQWDLAYILIVRGQFVEAEVLLEQVAATAETLGMRRELTYVRYQQAILFTKMSLNTRAQPMLEEACSFLGTTFDQLGLHHCRMALGNVLTNLGQYSKAKALLLPAKEFFHSKRFRLEHTQCLTFLAVLSWKESRDCSSVDLLEEARAESESIGAPYEAAQSLASLALIRAEQGKTAEAKDLYANAISMFESIGLPIDASKCQEDLDKLSLVTSQQ